MRLYVVLLCVGLLWSAEACDKLQAPPPDMGELDFQKDSSCADTTNTELFVDGVSQGQYTMRPGSIVGFSKTAGTHLAHATELAGQLRQFASQAVVVPPLGQAAYVMKCATRPPPDTLPSPPSPPAR
jgi:hypothetical protein